LSGAEDVLQTFQTDIPADKPYIPDKPADKQEKPPQ